jgi:ABC-type uncharacterized transport system substrate-binding protein
MHTMLFMYIVIFLIFPIEQLFAATSRILVVHSYHEAQENHVVPMNQGIQEALSGMDAEVLYFYMDTKNNNTTEWKVEAGKQAAVRVDSYHPDIVITMDDNAQEYFAKQYVSSHIQPFFVFGGVNADPATYGFPAKNVTGILERPNITESIQLLQKIVPEVKTMVFISDVSPTANSFIQYAKSLDLPVSVIAYEQVTTLDEWKQTLSKYEDKVDAIGLYVLRTVNRSVSEQTMVPEQELVQYLNSSYRMPTVGFFDSAANAGVLCGVSVSMKEQGYATGSIAREILEGKQPEDFALESTRKGRIQINLNTAERLGLQINYNIIKRADVVVR